MYGIESNGRIADGIGGKIKGLAIRRPNQKICNNSVTKSFKGAKKQSK